MMSSSDRVNVSLAILYRQGHFLMQLRDDIENIVYPGQWALFGGHMEKGETPVSTIQRELVEEIGYFSNHPILFGTYSCQRTIRYVYHAPLTMPLEQLVLNEGWDFKLLSPAIIHQGKHYSDKSDDERTIIVAHQKILSDFLDNPPFEFSYQ